MEAQGTPDMDKLGQWLFNRPCSFMLGVTKLQDLPNQEKVEIAFAGRSNVGKSSLINALVGERQLARTSNTPGRTQEINFFDLGGLLNVVDLPGYGYAAVTKTKVSAWNELIRLYLKGRVSLTRVFVLIDSRHGLKENDQEILKLLDQSAVSYQIVLTKADKIKESALKKLIHHITENELPRHTAAYPKVLATSSAKGHGLPELKATVAQLLVDLGRLTPSEE
ncbi:MAG: ribosome biogenesis GTP-binding protein YihA/YsxC [Holosporales bacterium]